MTADSTNRSVGCVRTQTVTLDLPDGGLSLDNGAVLPEVQVAYETYGRLSEARDNAIFICHALSGDAHVAGTHDPDDPATVGWWDQMVGPGKGIDTDHYFVICANILGGCKGTTGPSSINPRTGKPYGAEFPQITVGDIVRVHCLLVRQLGLERLAAVIGGSFGGMQVLEWVIQEPSMVGRGIAIASAASLSAQALAFDVVGRKAITYDSRWNAGNYYDDPPGPEHGLSLARKIGHITYLSKEMMTHKFGRSRGGTAREATFHSDFQVESYLEHQGRKFVERFDANSYLHITRAMDEFDLIERCGSLEGAFQAVEAKMLVVALSDDWLFPPEQSLQIANALLHAGKHVSYCELDAPQGHDAFLINVEHLADVIRAFLPWVGPQERPRSARSRERAARRNRGETREMQALLEIVPQGSRVLDLGCGNGQLLSELTRRRGITGMGVEIDLHDILQVIDRGHDVFQRDIDTGLASVPDQSYDIAILRETLQEVHKPRFVLNEMLRVARDGIVTFPNFGKWSHRLYLCAQGRMPKGGAIPFEWYNTPNIHLFTLRDFVDLCRQDGIHICDVVCIPEGRLSSLLVGLHWCNVGADRVVVRISRRPPPETPRNGGSRPACRTCTCST